MKNEEKTLGIQAFVGANNAKRNRTGMLNMASPSLAFKEGIFKEAPDSDTLYPPN